MRNGFSTERRGLRPSWRATPAKKWAMTYMVFSINSWVSKFNNRDFDGDADDGYGVGEGRNADKPEKAGQPAQRIDVGAGDDMAPRFDAHLVAHLGFDWSYVHGLAPSFVYGRANGEGSVN